MRGGQGTGTPCIRVCKLEGNRCTGCLRTLEEIANWLKYTDQERDSIMKSLKDRKKS